MKPDFLVIGAAKCATTSLCSWLGEHPAVYMAQPKEPHFFSMDDRYAHGRDWYTRHFRHHEDGQAIGEGSVTYSMTGVYPRTVERIACNLPEARLIYIVRHPLERLESLWMEWRNSSAVRVPRSFAATVREVPHFIDSSLYRKQIDAYREHFLDDRILVLFFDDLKRDPAAVLQRCFDFIGVGPPDRPTRFEAQNVSAAKKQDTRLLSLIRNLPQFDSLRDVLPGGVRRTMRSVFKSTITERPQWDEESLHWVRERIGKDVRKFLSFYGKPADFWLLESDGPYSVTTSSDSEKFLRNSTP